MMALAPICVACSSMSSNASARERSQSSVRMVMLPPMSVCRPAPMVPMTERDRTVMPRTTPRVRGARPITNDERRQRLEKARQLMRANSLDAILVSWGTSLLYYAGIRWQGGERLFALVLPAKGEPFFVAPAFEEGRAREQIERGPFDKNTDLRLWQEDESPYERVAQGLKDRG